MKAIIWIIVVALIAWGVWWFVRDGETIDTTDTGANASGALDFDLNGDGNVSTNGDEDIDLTEFEDKG